MSKTRIIAGIELGSSKTATIIAQVQTDPVSFDNTINIVGVASIDSKGVKKCQIVDIEEAVETTIASVEAAERMAGYNLDSAYVALGGAHISSQNSHGVVAVSDPDGEISPDDVERVIEAASAVSLPSSRELIHVIPREFVVDGESGVKDPIGMSGVRLEVDTHIITASNAAVKNLRKAIDEVGVDINGLVFSGIAASESVLTKTEKELGCVLVDVGGGTTSISVYIDGSLTYSGVIPVGSKNVTNDLAIGLRVSLESAEKIKIMLSDEKDKRTKSTKEKDQIDLSSVGIRETKKVSKPKGVSGLIDDVINPTFAVPVGLVLYGANWEPRGNVKSITSRIKLPSRGIVGKVVETIKDLLP